MARASSRERCGLKRITTHSPEETAAVAKRLADGFRPGTVVALIGDLGTGKTAFVKAAAQALGVREEVTSPTYTIISEYDTDPPVVHMDLYRLQAEGDFELLGVEEYLEGEAITLIEWADRAEGALPRDRTVWIRLAFGAGDTRIFEIEEPE